jgi:hypothetical protein
MDKNDKRELRFRAFLIPYQWLRLSQSILKVVVDLIFDALSDLLAVHIRILQQRLD